jgi:hypothetical protein
VNAETLFLDDDSAASHVDLRSIVAQGVSKDWSREPILTATSSSGSASTLPQRADPGVVAKLRQFLDATGKQELLRLWLGDKQFAELSKLPWKRCIEQIQRDVAQLDRLIG